MCSLIDSGEKGYKLPEQILFNSLVLYLTLHWLILFQQLKLDCLDIVKESVFVTIKVIFFSRY